MKKIFIVLLVLMLSGGWLIGGCSSSNGTPGPTTTPPSSPPEGWQVGQFAPDFELPDLSGKRGSLSSFRGKPVFLNFWATW